MNFDPIFSMNCFGMEVIVLEKLIAAGEEGLQLDVLWEEVNEKLPYVRMEDIMKILQSISNGILSINIKNTIFEHLQPIVDEEHGLIFKPTNGTSYAYIVNADLARRHITEILQKYPNCVEDVIKNYIENYDKNHEEAIFEEYLTTQDEDRHDALRFFKNLSKRHTIDFDGKTKLSTVALNKEYEYLIDELDFTKLFNKVANSNNFENVKKIKKPIFNANKILHQLTYILEKSIQDGLILSSVDKVRYKVTVLKIIIVSMYLKGEITLNSLMMALYHSDEQKLYNLFEKNITNEPRKKVLMDHYNTLNSIVKFKYNKHTSKGSKIPKDQSSYITKSTSKRIIYAPNRG